MSTEQTHHVSEAHHEATMPTTGAEIVAAHHDEEEHIHLPGPSYWPLLLAIAMAMTLTGLIVDYSISLVGILLAFIFGIGWGAGWGLERHQQAAE